MHSLKIEGVVGALFFADDFLFIGYSPQDQYHSHNTNVFIEQRTLE
jgi:hypothetical protein